MKIILKVQTARLIRYLLTSLLALSAGIMISVLILTFSVHNPLSTLTHFFSGPFSAPYYIGTMLNMVSLLTWAALGASASIISGNFNLGGEGQIYISGCITAILLNKLSILPAIIALPITAAAAFFTAGITAAISGMLKIYRNISELLSSFLISAAVIPLIDAAIAGPLRDTHQNLLATPQIAQQFQLCRLMPPSPLNSSLFAAVAVYILCAWLLFRTTAGKQFRICGTAPEFSRYSGLNPLRSTLIGMFISGGLHGLTGFFAVTGTYFSCPAGFYTSMGWNALTTALIAHCNPTAILPASLFLSWLLTATDKVVLTNNLAFDLTGIIQASVLLCISAQLILHKREKHT